MQENGNCRDEILFSAEIVDLDKAKQKVEKRNLCMRMNLSNKLRMEKKNE